MQNTTSNTELNHCLPAELGLRVPGMQRKALSDLLGSIDCTVLGMQFAKPWPAYGRASLYQYLRALNYQQQITPIYGAFSCEMRFKIVAKIDQFEKYFSKSQWTRLRRGGVHCKN